MSVLKLGHFCETLVLKVGSVWPVLPSKYKTTHLESMPPQAGALIQDCISISSERTQGLWCSLPHGRQGPPQGPQGLAFSLLSRAHLGMHFSLSSPTLLPQKLLSDYEISGPQNGLPKESLFPKHVVNAL